MLECAPALFRCGQLHTPGLDALFSRPLRRPASPPSAKEPPRNPVRQAPHDDASGHDFLVQCLHPTCLSASGHSPAVER